MPDHMPLVRNAQHETAKLEEMREALRVGMDFHFLFHNHQLGLSARSKKGRTS